MKDYRVAERHSGKLPRGMPSYAEVRTEAAMNKRVWAIESELALKRYHETKEAEEAEGAAFYGTQEPCKLPRWLVKANERPKTAGTRGL